MEIKVSNFGSDPCINTHAYNICVGKVQIAATIWQGQHPLEGDRWRSKSQYNVNMIWLLLKQNWPQLTCIRSADKSVCELRNTQRGLGIKLCKLT